VFQKIKLNACTLHYSVADEPLKCNMLVERPTLGRVITNTQTGMWSEEIPFAYYVLYICSYAYDMRKRRVLNDNEWSGWLQWMRNCFQQGTIKEHWKTIQSER
jgi:hypothetical protein